MSLRVLYDDVDLVVASAVADEEHLWLTPDDLAVATGWVLKPQGLCREEACVQLPRDGSWVDAAARVDLAAFARAEGRPSVRDDERGIWAFGEPVERRTEAALSVQAPEVTLPDVHGVEHSLSDYRGKKIFLHTFGSY